MKIFIKSIIYSLFLAASLNIAPVMASGHSSGGRNDGGLGSDGRAHGQALKFWADEMSDIYKGLATGGTLRGQGSHLIMPRRPLDRPTARPTRP